MPQQRAKALPHGQFQNILRFVKNLQPDIKVPKSKVSDTIQKKHKGT